MQKKLLKSIKNFVNADVIFSFASNFVGLIKGPIVMLLIPIFLTSDAQGYWYTFGSLSALSVFADLGFATIASQFSAHEFAHLRFDNKKNILGEDLSLNRLASLYKFVIKWAVVVCLIAFPIIFIIGCFVLNMHTTAVMWFIPWIIMVTTSGINFIIKISLTFLEGCGQIKNVQLNNLICAILTSVVTVAMLITKCELYALVIPAVVNAVVSLSLMLIVFHRPLKQLISTKIKFDYNWKHSFLKLIWKYAISWASGYFIFQIYTPLAFMMYDPTQAGKIGITLSLIQACFNLSSTWCNVLIPKINMSVANKDWKRAETLSKKGGVLSIGTYIIGSIIILCGIGFLQEKIGILQRFLGIIPITFLLISYLLQIPINIIANYGRAHKQEPFMLISILSGAIIGASTLILVFIAPIEYIFVGFTFSNIISLITFIVMFFKLKSKWHEKFIISQTEELSNVEKQITNLNIEINTQNDNNIKQ